MFRRRRFLNEYKLWLAKILKWYYTKYILHIIQQLLLLLRFPRRHKNARKSVVVMYSRMLIIRTYCTYNTRTVTSENQRITMNITHIILFINTFKSFREQTITIESGIRLRSKTFVGNNILHCYARCTEVCNQFNVRRVPS